MQNKAAIIRNRPTVMWNEVAVVWDGVVTKYRKTTPAGVERRRKWHRHMKRS